MDPATRQEGPESILQAAARRPILDAATRRWFTVLAEDAGQEIVVGALGTRQGIIRGAPGEFQAYRESPYTKMAFNFSVEGRGPQRCVVTTETRVYCVGVELRKRFACYWRVIYPGSSIVRSMWLRAIRQRAEP